MWKTYMEKSTTKLPAVKVAPKKKWDGIDITFIYYIGYILKYWEQNKKLYIIKFTLKFYRFMPTFLDGNRSEVNCNFSISFGSYIYFIRLDDECTYMKLFGIYLWYLSEENLSFSIDLLSFIQLYLSFNHRYYWVYWVLIRLIQCNYKRFNNWKHSPLHFLNDF